MAKLVGEVREQLAAHSVTTMSKMVSDAAQAPMDKLEAMVKPATLSDLPQLGADILQGQVQGRVVVDVNA